MGKIMLNGVDYSAPTAGGSSRSCVIFDGALKSGSTTINVSSYSEYLHSGLSDTHTYSSTGGCAEYAGTVYGSYIMTRVVASIDNKTFCCEVVPSSPNSATICMCPIIGSITNSITCNICSTFFTSAIDIYPPNTYGNAQTTKGYIRIQMSINKVLTISLNNPNGLVLHRVELI